MAESKSEGAQTEGLTKSSASKSSRERREIPGNFTYTTAFGPLKKALEGIIVAERPSKLSGDFLGTVLKITGGSAKPIPPILKRMGFLESDGTPTDLYSKFKSDYNRSAAAFEGLKRAFPELFRHNDFIHRAGKDEVVDLIAQITGLTKKDPIINAISSTFEAIRAFISKDPASLGLLDASNTVAEPEVSSNSAASSIQNDLTLAYNINIILPETTNIQVFNAIFQSLKANLLNGR
ncbi:MAG: DUF5343 domain-containing protein [Methylobacterium radiotolerans]